MTWGSRLAACATETPTRRGRSVDGAAIVIATGLETATATETGSITIDGTGKSEIEKKTGSRDGIIPGPSGRERRIEIDVRIGTRRRKLGARRRRPWGSEAPRQAC
jgi:hypothetical protein